MKKIFVILSCAVLLASCGPSTPTSSTPSSSTAPSSTPSSSTSTPLPPSTSQAPSIIDGTLPELELEELKEFSFTPFSTPFSLLGDSNPAVIGKTYIITNPGTYTLSGHLEGGSVQVKKGVGKVKLILAGVSIKGSNAAIFIKSLNDVVLEVKSGTKNYLDDGSVEDFEAFYKQEAEDEPKGTICSKSKLEIIGDGELYIISEAKEIAYQDPLTGFILSEAINGIQSKKSDLLIKDTKVFIKSISNGIKVKGNLALENSSIEIHSSGDGIEIERNLDLVSLNDSGNFFSSLARLVIKAKKDGIDAEAGIVIDSGDYSITTGEGHTMVDDFDSHSGLKAESDLTDGVSLIELRGGIFNIDSAKDAISCDKAIKILGGDIVIKSADDALNSKTDMTIVGEKVNIFVLKSLEGIKAKRLTLGANLLYIDAMKDGINVNAEKSSPQRVLAPGDIGDESFLLKTGMVVLNTGENGLNVNGKIKITGGTLLVNGPLDSFDSAIDYNGSFEVTGGIIISTGPKESVKTPTNESTINTINISQSSISAANYLVITDATDTSIIVFKLSKPISSFVFSSNLLVSGSTYNIFTATKYLGGSNIFGVCTGGQPQNLVKLGSVNIDSKLTILE